MKVLQYLFSIHLPANPAAMLLLMIWMTDFFLHLYYITDKACFPVMWQTSIKGNVSFKGNEKTWHWYTLHQVTSVTPQVPLITHPFSVTRLGNKSKIANTAISWNDFPADRQKSRQQQLLGRSTGDHQESIFNWMWFC